MLPSSGLNDQQLLDGGAETKHFEPSLLDQSKQTE